MNRTPWKYYRDLIWTLVSKELKLRYRNTVFGYAWSVLSPLLFTLVYFLAFKIIMRFPMANYPVFLVTGLFPWQWFSNSVVSSNRFFLNNSSLIRKVQFPRYFLVLAGVLNDTIHFAISIPVIVLFMLYYRTYPSLTWFWALPMMILLQFLLTYSVALILATCNTFSQDLERLTVILTTLWFFVTPVIYPANLVPPRLRWGLYINPMAGVIACWRGILLEGRVPPDLFGSAVAGIVLAFLIGQKIYKLLEWRIAEVV